MAKLRSLLCAAAIGLASTGALANPAVYDTPQDALEAMMTALGNADRAAVLTVFGLQSADMLSTGDEAEDAANRETILGLYAEGYRFVPSDGDAVILALGAEAWPFPIPLARSSAGWSFDIVAGEAEIVSREIGRNELGVIELMHAYVDVQAAFRLIDHDGDGVMEFAQQIISSEEARDGLFWIDGGGPVGELLARASATGFSDGVQDHGPEPHLGYIYRILQGQSPAAPGGEMSYLVNGNMVSGHALLAVPAAYGESGVHSFLVAENGEVLEADLGEETLVQAAEITVYDPQEDWAPVD